MEPPIVTIRLGGEPQGAGRPRFARASGRAYTPAATRDYRAALTFAAQEAMAGRPPRVGSLAVAIRADMPIPKSLSKKARAEVVCGHLRPTKKPDLDNIVKQLDSFNQIVWVDDAQVVSLTAEKHYSETPALTIEVRAL